MDGASRHHAVVVVPGLRPGKVGYGTVGIRRWLTEWLVDRLLRLERAGEAARVSLGRVDCGSNRCELELRAERVRFVGWWVKVRKEGPLPARPPCPICRSFDMEARACGLARGWEHRSRGCDESQGAGVRLGDWVALCGQACWIFGHLDGGRVRSGIEGVEAGALPSWTASRMSRWMDV
jgi:hypothetical protein